MTFVINQIHAQSQPGNGCYRTTTQAEYQRLCMTRQQEPDDREGQCQAGAVDKPVYRFLILVNGLELPFTDAADENRAWLSCPGSVDL